MSVLSTKRDVCIPAQRYIFKIYTGSHQGHKGGTHEHISEF